MINQAVHSPEQSDAELVAKSLNGSRGAFRQIVERYQTLVCSIAYGATGSVSRSEDVAQETFIAAWTRLRSLREPDKLRGWLCGIVRNRIHRNWRDEVHEPAHHALPIENAGNIPAAEATPSEQAVSREEEAILWRSLEQIPPLYREPLILFYREHQSIEEMAAALELSEDTARQRLSRGRKLLQEAVQSMVESTLRRTAPGQTFSAAVLTMLPITGGATVATAQVGWGTKGTAAVKSVWVASLLLPLAPFVGMAAGMAALWLAISDATVDRISRRKKIGQMFAGWIVYLAAAVGGEWLVQAAAQYWRWDSQVHFVALAAFWTWFVGASITLPMVFGLRLHELNRKTQKDFSLSLPPPPSFTLILIIAGVHLALFLWLIALAWRLGDRSGAEGTAAVMLALGGWSYFRCRKKTGTALEKIIFHHLALLAVTLALIVNLRMRAWMAYCFGVSLTDVGNVVPLWIVPMLTLALVLWSALVFRFTRVLRGVPNRNAGLIVEAPVTLEKSK